MGTISLIAVIDEANGLGINNKLLCHLPADLQHFKAITMNKPIVMGRSTYESIGSPLPGRMNIILSKTTSSIEGVVVVNSLDKAIAQAGDAPEIMVIGGAQVFEEAMSKATKLYITRIHHHFTADVYFPKFDEHTWHCRKKEFRQHDDKNKYDLTFYTYERN